MRALHEDAGKGDQGGSDKRKIPPTPLYERGCYRNFVSLDTRSREVRNRPQSTNKGLQPLAPDTVDSQPLALNVVVRTYQSSVGQECFISYEDELGYLYGFIRLLLPSPDQTVDFP